MSGSINSSKLHKKRSQRERVERYRKKRFKKGRLNLGSMDQTCSHYRMKFWLSKKNRNSSLFSPKFFMCYAGDKVHLPLVLDPSPYLFDLYSEVRNFCNNIRAYNRLLACSYFDANIDKSFQS